MSSETGMSNRIAVVGSGPVGACVARRLVERGAAVTVFEGGEAVSAPAGSHLRNSEPFRSEPDAYFARIAPFLASPWPAGSATSLPAAAVTHAVGGQGILWTNNCPRPTPDERWTGAKPTDWETYATVAERFLMVRPASGSRRQARIRAHLAAAYPRRSVVDQPFAGRIGSAGQVRYVAPADVLAPHADRIRIVQARVDRVVIEDGHTIGIDVQGSVHRFTEVVVAAGALETPGILARSGVRLPALGRWLTYHDVLVAQVVLDRKIADVDDATDLPPRLMIPPQPGRPWHVMLLRDTNPLTPLAPDEVIEPWRLVEIQAFSPIDPSPVNHIDLESGIIDVRLSAVDRARRADVEADVVALVGTLGRPRAGCQPSWLPAGAHVMGTSRMGTDTATSVVDTDGRVHGVNGLWLAGTGLIPSRMAVNPTLTAAAFGIRTADRIH